MNAVAATSRTQRNRRRRQRQALRARERQMQVVPAQQAPQARRRRRGVRAQEGMGRITDFVKCAVHPFGHAGTLTGVPDRYNGVSVVLENRTTKSITLGGTDTLILVTDWPGFNLCWWESPGSWLRDLKTGKNSSANMSQTNFCSAFAQYRTMALGVRVLSTGADLYTAGIASVGLVPLKVQYKGDGLIGAAVNRAVALENIPLKAQDILSAPDSMQFRIKDGFMAVSKHCAGDSWNFAEVDEEAVACCGYDLKPNKGGVPQTIVSLFSATEDETPFVGSDGNCFAIAIRIQGANTSTHIQVETVHCIEAVPITAVYRSLARPSPPADPQQLDSLSRLQRQAPVGCTIQEEPSWGQILKAAAIGAGRIGFGLAQKFLGLNIGGNGRALTE